MSQVKIALQPPPNVDFVVGYPGIPPGARDRPQAAVKGAVEVRVSAQGVKAKWVRVELKKVETLPGGGQTNSYFDFVGQGPMNLWQSTEEYGLLESQDLPFQIRIPESIPPSIALERGAGIRYELLATVCTLGKKGFFRRRKTIVTSSATTIIIDKHELHSTWPVYAQPESRSVTQDGVHLTVERQRTCFGPGDRLSVMAILKSDSVHSVVLRGFEFALKETTIFRAGPQAGATGKRSGPQVKVAIIGEQKVPLNVPLFAGMVHKAEVGCPIPNTHTTTTLNAARHIDITYAIVVKAWFGLMQSVSMDLPVIVSNWPRSVSEEAVRRIGTAPSLCIFTPSSTATTVPIPSRPLTGTSQTSDYNISTPGQGRTPLAPPATSIQYKSSPSAPNGDSHEADELGTLKSRQRVTGTVDHPDYGSSPQTSMGSIPEDSTGAVRPIGGSGRRRRGSAAAGGPANRLTITNISDRDAEVREAVEQEQLATRLAQQTTPLTRAQRSWISAEEEKKKLYENAKAKVERVQGSAVMTPQPSETSSQLKTSQSARAAWPTAEEEKIRLFDKAQATAKRTQELGAHSRDNSETNGSSGMMKTSRSTSAISAGAALYQHAVSSMSKNPTGNASPGASANISPPHSPHPPSPPLASGSSKTVPHYPSAEEEKAALKRYHEAKLAVDRSQNTQYASHDGISSSSAPVAYDTLYPSAGVSRNGTLNQAGGSDMPPPFDGPDDQPHYLNEKEKLRRQYEAQDAAALAAQNLTAPSDMSPSYTTSHPYSPPGQSSVMNALSEKELLRRRYEEQDAAALAQQQPLPPPPRAVNGSRLPPPAPPSGSGFRPLTAAEEKAQLRAKYAAEEQQTNGHGNGSASASSSGFPFPPNGDPSPPPLMPRPPVEYIQETQEEDARVRYLVNSGIDNSPVHGSPLVGSGPGIQLDIRPFTPFSVGLYDPGSPGAQRHPPPPPLPPQN